MFVKVIYAHFIYQWWECHPGLQTQRQMIRFIWLKLNDSLFYCLELDECESDPCIHADVCMDDVNRYVCKCSPGYTGLNCESGISFAFNFENHLSFFILKVFRLHFIIISTLTDYSFFEMIFGILIKLIYINNTGRSYP